MGTDSTAEDFIIRRPIAGQHLQCRLFQCKFLLAFGSEFGNHRFDEDLILSNGLDIKATSTIQRSPQAALRICGTVRTLIMPTNSEHYCCCDGSPDAAGSLETTRFA